MEKGCREQHCKCSPLLNKYAHLGPAPWDSCVALAFCVFYAAACSCVWVFLLSRSAYLKIGLSDFWRQQHLSPVTHTEEQNALCVSSASL